MKTGNVLNMQHIAPNSKRCNDLGTPDGGTFNIGIITFPHIGITQSTRHKITQRKRSIRNETQKVKALRK